MDLALTDEQRQLQEAVARYLRKDYTFERRREILVHEQGCSAETWRALADLGLLAVGIPETHGGLGGTAVETMLVAEELGRALLLEPYVPSVVVGAGLVARHGTDGQRAEHLPRAFAGDLRFAFAHEEAGGRYDLATVATRAEADGDDVSLHGRKTVVIHGESAQVLIVSARESGEPGDRDGVSLYLVPTGAEGIALSGYPTHDGMRACDVTLSDVHLSSASRLGPRGHAMPLIEHAIDRAVAAYCAEAVGAMAALIEITGNYLKTRRQFGVPLGSFQALQHRMADMLMRLEQARSMSLLAADRVEREDAERRRPAIAAAKMLIGRAARFVGEQAVQLHGGVGVTDELSVSHYFKRLVAIDATFGDAEYHLAAYSALLERHGAAVD
jgi:alkylation response protein AidB-like acyl-CoA dehydrogenase